MGHDYGKWGTIPLLAEKCPTSQRNPAPHHSGMLPHFKRNQCPTSTGIRSLANYRELKAALERICELNQQLLRSDRDGAKTRRSR